MIHILRDVLEGLRDLHTNSISHGCVDVQTVLVEKVDGLFRGRLDFYPISNPVKLCCLTKHYGDCNANILK